MAARATAAPAPPRPRTRRQYGVVPYRRVKDRIEILLITSRNTGRWIIPKGWPIGRKPPRDVARLEALEEAGLEGAIAKRPCGAFHYQKRLNDGAVVLCRVSVFALEVGRQRRIWPESRERKRRWFAAERAIALVREAELKALIGVLLRSLEKRSPATTGKPRPL